MEKLINLLQLDKLSLKGGYVLKQQNKRQEKQDQHKEKSLKTGSKKLNGPNRPST